MLKIQVTYVENSTYYVENSTYYVENSSLAMLKIQLTILKIQVSLIGPHQAWNHTKINEDRSHLYRVNMSDPLWPSMA